MLGTDELYAYIDKYHIRLDPQYDELLGRYFSRRDVGKYRSDHMTLDIQGNHGPGLSPQRTRDIYPMMPSISWISYLGMTTKNVLLRVKPRDTPTSVSNLQVYDFSNLMRLAQTQFGLRVHLQELKERVIPPPLVDIFEQTFFVLSLWLFLLYVFIIYRPVIFSLFIHSRGLLFLRYVCASERSPEPY